MRALNTLLGLFGLGALAGIALPVFLLGGWGDGPHPSDAELLELVDDESVELEVLRRLAASQTPPEGMTILFTADATPENMPARRRLQDEMRELDVDVSLQYSAGPSPSLVLAMHSRGLLTSGSIKGLIWSPSERPGTLMQSLDGDTSEIADRGCPEHDRCVRAAGGGWYLFYQYDR